MGRESNMQGRDEKRIQNFSQKPEGKRSLRDLCMDRRIILRLILGKQCVDWFHLVQYRI
jgi:hypothetical protein